MSGKPPRFAGRGAFLHGGCTEQEPAPAWPGWQNRASYARYGPAGGGHHGRHHG